MGKTDSTGTYAYVCDGTTPGSPVLSDGHALYTPGLSERRAGVSSFYADDKLGNLWIVNGTGTTQSYYQDTTGFGALTASGGSSATPFKFGGGNGCLTDADTGLVLMGHRYYDSRTGRFISQDPAKSGNNWYAYAGNNPVNKTDPTGLQELATDDTAMHDTIMGYYNAFKEGGQAGADAWDTIDASSEHGRQQYLVEQAIAKALAAKKRYYNRRLNTPGTVWNGSDYSIPIMFDHGVDPHKIFYIMMLPPHTYTEGEDIDFVYAGNDPSASGGYDWRHIWGLTNCVIWDAGSSTININGIYRDGLFKGYPYNVSPLPVSGNISIQIMTIPSNPTIRPLPIGPIP